MSQENKTFIQIQIDRLNEMQRTEGLHPFTCCSPDDIPECKRAKNEGETPEEREGVLIATVEGWICPCGKYKQNLVHPFMTNEQ
jgi:hypothetical protein